MHNHIRLSAGFPGFTHEPLYTMSSSSSAVQNGVTKPRQRLNKAGASEEHNKAMEDLLKKVAQKKKVGMDICRESHSAMR